MRSRYLSSLVRQTHRLFDARQVPLSPSILRPFSQNTKLNNDDKIMPLTYLAGAGLIGGFLALTYWSWQHFPAIKKMQCFSGFQVLLK